jgi:hypothetical protein
MIPFLKDYAFPSFWKNAENQRIWLAIIEALMLAESSRYLLQHFPLKGHSALEEQFLCAANKLKSFLAEALACQSGLHPELKPWTIIQENKKDTIHAWFIYYLAGSWNGTYFIHGINEKYSSCVSLNPAGSQAVYFVKTSADVLELLDSKTIFSTCFFDPVQPSTIEMSQRFPAQNLNEPQQKQQVQEIKQYLSNLGEKAPPLTLSLTFYERAPIWGDDKEPNFREFVALLDPNNLTILACNIKSAHSITQSQMKNLLKLIEVNKEKWVEGYFSTFPFLSSFECLFPNSPYDWAFTECLLYSTLKQDVVKHAELICWLAENQEVELTEEAIQKHASEEEKTALKQSDEVELSPETLVKIMHEQATTEMREAFEKEKASESESPTISPQLIEEDKQAAQRIEPKKKGKDVEKITPKTTSEKKSSPPQKYDEKQLLQDKLNTMKIGPKEQQKVKRVFSGQSVKDFNDLVIALAQVEMKANPSQEGRRGSHHSVRFRRSGGKTGQTLWHPHGKQKGNEVSVHSQKKTLKNILNL